MARNFVAGSSQYLSYAGNIITGLPFSAGFWATKPVTGDTDQVVFGSENGANTHHLKYDSNNITFPAAIRRFRVRIQAGLASATLVANGADADWNFVVSTHRGGFGVKHRLYLDGVETANSSTTVTAVLTGGSTTVGRSPTGATQYYDGSVEWVFMIPVVLTAFEIGCMYRNGPPWRAQPEQYAGGAGACWPMTGGASPETNFMGYGTYDLTLNNGPTRVIGAPVSVPDGLIVA